MTKPNPPYSRIERKLLTLQARLRETLGLVELRIAQIAFGKGRKSCP
jgi:hypothetical protein